MREEQDIPSFPNVLIISHNPLSRVYNNGKTMLSFFENWPREKLSQIYLTLDPPDFSIINQYYRISDNDILRSILRKYELPGQKITPETYSNTRDNATKEKWFYRAVRFFYVNRLPLASIIRSSMWRRKTWDNEHLWEWIERVSPDIVFFQCGNVSAVFDFVEKVCSNRGIPLIMQSTDDYIGAHFSVDPFFWLYLRDMRKSYKRAVDIAYRNIVIGEMMRNEYMRMFGGRYYVAMNSVSVHSAKKCSDQIPNTNTPSVSYFGNLGLGRGEVIAHLAKRMEPYAINFRVYSMMKPSKRQSRMMKKLNNLRFMGGVTGEQFSEALRQSDVLLHVESFKRRHKIITRLSISTKIPEYLASGKTILACGPAGIASIDYLRSSKTAVIITGLNAYNAEMAFNDLMNPQLKHEMCERALKAARENHDVEKIRLDVMNDIVDAVRISRVGKRKDEDIPG